MSQTSREKSLEELIAIMGICEFEKVDEVEKPASFKEVFTRIDPSRYYLLVAYDQENSPVCWFVLKGPKFTRGYCEAIDQSSPYVIEKLSETVSVSRVTLYRLIPPTEYYGEHWKLGHEEIDRQHSNILEKWNELVYGVIEGREDLVKTLEELITTVHHHLDYEEGLMKRYKYPYMKSHVKEHEYLRGALKEIARLAKVKGVLAAMVEEMGFVEAYIDHFHRQDSSLVAYLKMVESIRR